METLKEEISSIGFCWIDKSGKVVMRQKGIIRTVWILKSFCLKIF